MQLPAALSVLLLGASSWTNTNKLKFIAQWLALQVCMNPELHVLKHSKEVTFLCQPSYSSHNSLFFYCVSLSLPFIPSYLLFEFLSSVPLNLFPFVSFFFLCIYAFFSYSFRFFYFFLTLFLLIIIRSPSSSFPLPFTSIFISCF
jgi:hypothetical protein